MKTAVVIFPGSNCEQDTLYAIEKVSGEKAIPVWHKDRIPAGVGLVVLPGGFSYGDYLRCGAIARFSPVMQSVIEYANAGGLVMGICNGFQILVEARLLPGALIRNRSLHFICKWVHLKREKSISVFTDFDKDLLHIPIAHATGNYFIESDGLLALEKNKQIVFRYCSPEGEVASAWNPNGSLNNIAGICNVNGNVMGMMPHPERALDDEFPSRDGWNFWQPLLDRVKAGNFK